MQRFSDPAHSGPVTDRTSVAVSEPLADLMARALHVGRARGQRQAYHAEGRGCRSVMGAGQADFVGMFCIHS